MRFRSVLLATTILALPLAAQAQRVSGLYVSVGAGVNYKTQQDVVGATGESGPYAGTLFGSGFGGVGGGPSGLELNFGTGWAGVAAIGYGFGNGLRAEIEGNYRSNRYSQLHGTTFPTASGGTDQTYGAMVNAYYDFDLAPYGWNFMTPYLGVGAGYGWTTFSSAKSYGTNFPFFGKTNDTDGNFAYQAIAGAAFPIQSVPGLSLTAEYRFFSVLGDTTYRGFIDTGAQLEPGRTFGQVKLGTQYNHSIMLGVRYAFNAAPPPPPPAPVVAPAPAPTRSYLVFFDWDRADLTDRARQIVREAAENSARVQYTRIEVNGYTDTSGTPQYNQRLSVRRAQAVAAELVKNGVPRNAITIQGFGQTHLLVPTGDGVREPQNRRVEIIIR